jgi:hypothetical protein
MQLDQRFHRFLQSHFPADVNLTSARLTAFGFTATGLTLIAEFGFIIHITYPHLNTNVANFAVAALTIKLTLCNFINDTFSLFRMLYPSG